MRYEKTLEKLVFIAGTANDRERLRDVKDLYEALEPIICNSSLAFIAPEDVGALTDAPIIGEVSRDDHGGINTVYSLYWFPSYMVTDPLEELRRTGRLEFMAGMAKKGMALCVN